MAVVLVSGAEEQVERLAEALRGRGADVTEVTDLEDMPKVCADAGTAVYDAYVQLPSTFQMPGETVVDRVHHSYANGVLARYPALGAALPALKPGARITFVLGQLPPEAGSPDDRTAASRSPESSRTRPVPMRRKPRSPCRSSTRKHRSTPGRVGGMSSLDTPALQLLPCRTE